MGFVWNSLANKCSRRILPSDCRTVNCASNPDQYVGYPADPSLYVLCLVSDGSPITFRLADVRIYLHRFDKFESFLRCADSEQFIPSQRRCVFQCKNEGRFADSKDCSKYYECYRNGLSFSTMHRSCLTGSIFDSEENDCVEGTCTVEGTGDTGDTGGTGDSGTG